jgi:ATP-binding cassette subfamily B protein
VKFLAVYGRVLGLLRRDRGVAMGLVMANLMVMGFQFAEPVLFGRVINLLTGSDYMTDKSVIRGVEVLLSIWAGIGLISIGANISVAVQAWRGISAMFSHCRQPSIATGSPAG